MDKSHRNSEKFPYTTEELAIYMNYICNTMRPIVDEDEIDGGEIDEFIDEKEQRRLDNERIWEK